jgi:hypothetical protein
VLAVDVFMTDGAHRATADHFLTYNRSILAERVQDVLTAVAYLKSRPGIRDVDLAGLGTAGPWCILAGALTGHVRRLAANVDRFEYQATLAASSQMYSPGALRYGGMRAAAALGAPRDLLLYNTGESGVETLCRKVYGEGNLETRAGAATEAEVVAWLVR